VTDSLFSMDGDFADLQGLAALKRKHGFLLAVDEAHATLVCGARGEGAVGAAGVEDSVDLHIGTLSKAFGSMGGFVACSTQWKDLFVNIGRAQVFSTSLPVPVVASALAALKVAAKEPWRRQHAHELSQRVGVGLGVQAQSPIIPVVIGGEAETMAVCTALLGRGFHVPGIRPPTVPAGTSRLRISLSAGHSTSDVDELISAVREVCSAMGKDDSARMELFGEVQGKERGDYIAKL
jgi:8-amino-7-oxononanoate synthase